MLPANLNGEARVDENIRSSLSGSNIPHLIGMLGVPTIVLQLYGTQIRGLATKYPKTVTGLFASAACIILGQAIKDKLIDLLPVAQLLSDDPLYASVCKFVMHHYPPRDFQLDWNAQSTEHRRLRAGEVSWLKDHKGSKDIYSEYSGQHFFLHHGTFFIIQIATTEHESAAASKTLKLRAISLTREPIRALMQEAWDTYKSDNGARKTRVYSLGENYSGMCWIQTTKTDVRLLDSIHIKQSDKDKVVGDVTKFLDEDRRAWYRRQGIPYRRGFLFAGPPGTGKSSLAMAIAGQFNLNFCTVSLTDKLLTDRSIANLFSRLPSPCLLALEDIDSAGLTREVSQASISAETHDNTHESAKNDKPTSSMGITLAGLLNAIDGAAAQQGNILVLSTNFPEALDPALIREGRCDRTLIFRLADRYIAKSIFMKMMNEADISEVVLETRATEFASCIPEGIFAPARLQVYLLDHINEVDSAVANVHSWVASMLQQDNELGALQKKETVSKPEPRNRKDTFGTIRACRVATLTRRDDNASSEQSFESDYSEDLFAS